MSPPRSAPIVVLTVQRGRTHDESEPAESVTGLLQELGAEVRELELLASLSDVSAEEPRVLVLEPGARPDLAVLVARAIKKDNELCDVPLLLAVSERQVASLDVRLPFDDFVLTPYLPAEVYARIRRLEWRRSEFFTDEHVKMGDVYVDLAAHQVTLDGQSVDFTSKEYKLLLFLLAQRGRVLSREAILRQVWGARYEGGARTVDIHVRRLRAKLGEALPLVTVRGAGYKLMDRATP